VADFALAGLLVRSYRGFTVAGNRLQSKSPRATRGHIRNKVTRSTQSRSTKSKLFYSFSKSGIRLAPGIFSAAFFTAAVTAALV
jgi:hypothetical protein